MSKPRVAIAARECGKKHLKKRAFIACVKAKVKGKRRKRSRR